MGVTVDTHPCAQIYCTYTLHTGALVSAVASIVSLLVHLVHADVSITVQWHCLTELLA